MTRAVGILLGVATTRPVMEVFFATSSRTHLSPNQFFGIAFWIGFSINADVALRAELDAKGVPVKEGSWGYRLLVVDDLDGNQLLFNYPSEAASANIAGDEENV
jgi:hypothetical protein